MIEIDEARLLVRRALRELWTTCEEAVPHTVDHRDDKIEEMFERIVDAEIFTIEAGVTQG
jgi:hypothetical protein